MRKTLKTATTLEETEEIILNTTYSQGNLANIFDRLILEAKPNLLDRMDEAWERAGGKQGYRSRDDLKKHWRERERLDGFRYNILPHLWNGKDDLKLIAKFQGHPRPGDRGHKEWEKSLKNKTCEKCGGIWPARLKYFYSNGALSMLSPVCKNCQDKMGNYRPQAETLEQDYLPNREDCEKGLRELKRTRQNSSFGKEDLFDWLEEYAGRNGKVLKDDWRMIIERNFDIWFGQN